MPGVSYAGRSYTGDGLLMLHAGIELTRATGRAFFLEYSVGLPVVNDPGDFYGFATNHFFSIAFRTGRGNLYVEASIPARLPTDPPGARIEGAELEAEAEHVAHVVEAGLAAGHPQRRAHGADRERVARASPGG